MYHNWGKFPVTYPSSGPSSSWAWELRSFGTSEKQSASASFKNFSLLFWSSLVFAVVSVRFPNLHLSGLTLWEPLSTVPFACWFSFTMLHFNHCKFCPRFQMSMVIPLQFLFFLCLDILIQDAICVSFGVYDHLSVLGGLLRYLFHRNYFQSRFITQSMFSSASYLEPSLNQIIGINIPLSRSQTSLRGPMANLCRDLFVFRDNQMEFFFKSSQSLPQSSMVEVSKFPWSLLLYSFLVFLPNIS